MMNGDDSIVLRPEGRDRPPGGPALVRAAPSPRSRRRGIAVRLSRRLRRRHDGPPHGVDAPDRLAPPKIDGKRR
jgi:hypothetical protein